VTVDPCGQFAYVANFGDDTVSACTINSVTGVLTGIGPTSAGGAPVAVAVDPTGQVRLRRELWRRQSLGLYDRPWFRGANANTSFFTIHRWLPIHIAGDWSVRSRDARTVHVAPACSSNRDCTALRTEG